LAPTPLEVLTPTLAGHGPRGGVPAASHASPVAVAHAPTSLEDEADRIAALVATEVRASSAGAGPRLLCGYSLGARVGLTLLARHPELFDAAVLIGVNPGLEDLGARAERVASDEAWAQRLEREGLEAFVEAWEAQPLFVESLAGLPASVRGAERARRLANTPEGLAASLRAHGLGRMRPVDIARIQIPVTLLVGERDAKFRAIAEALVGRSGEAGARATVARPIELVVVEGAGHNVPLARPDAVAEALARAWRRQRGDAAPAERSTIRSWP
jgi:2-succinyl-6-hydroxy-2,4-cyclohexadiene-1-carboxylate synthase